MRILIILMLLFTGCSNIVSPAEFLDDQAGQAHLTGYHSYYLGSDSAFHYFELGNVVGSRIYRIKLSDLDMKKAYSYNKEKPLKSVAFIQLKK